jgi:hypothetical protein
MRKFSAIVLVGALAAATPAFAARDIITPSGRPDAVFEGSPLSDALSKVVNQCFNAGWTVTSQTNNQVVCELPVGSMQAAFQQMLLGNSYSTTPRSYARFSLAEVGNSTRAQANAWVETQMAFGQMRQQPYADDGTYNNLLNFLLASGGMPPPGSRMPGIYMGFDGEPQINGRKVTIPVTTIFSSGPGAESGLQVGDHISKVNGQTFKNFDDFKKKLNKIPVGVRYPIEVERDGKAMILTVSSKERPLVGSLEWTKMIEETRVARSGTAGPTAPAAP